MSEAKIIPHLIFKLMIIASLVTKGNFNLYDDMNTSQNEIREIRSLSEQMLETLMECHERELMKLEPCEVATTKHAKGLVQRGLLTTKFYTTEKGKNILALYLTELGFRYLNSL